MPPAADQRSTPFLDALVAFDRAGPWRFHIPGHKGGPGADPRLADLFGDRAVHLDIPAFSPLIEARLEAQRLAAEAFGAARTWFLTNGASQGSHAACLALAHRGGEVVVARNCHSSTIDGVVLSGLRPTFVAPELDPELRIAHCVTPPGLDRALAAAPRAAAAVVASPTYYGAAGDVRSLAEVAHARGVPLVVDEAWGAHFAFHEQLPESALAAGADLVISSTHKTLGSLTQSAMLHLGGERRLPERDVDRALRLVESTSPNSLLLGSLDASRRQAAVDGRGLLDRALAELHELRQAVVSIPGLDVLDPAAGGRTGVHGLDPLRLTIDLRGTGTSGYVLGPLLHAREGVVLELFEEKVLVAVFGMAEPAGERGRRLVEALGRVVEEASSGDGGAVAEWVPPPPWGPLDMAPREAFLGPQEAVPAEAAVGRIAAESLSVYAPGVPNVLPGERLTAATLDYIRQTVAQGGTLHGASDPTLRTFRVVT